MQTASELQTVTNCNEHLSGYELTHQTIHNLHQYDITATAKLVLVLLTTHYNQAKNGAVVFPSISYIADTLGIGETATKSAIKDLIKSGIILKSKLSRTGNHNKYILTSKVQKPTVNESETDFLKQSKSDRLHERTNNMKLNKQQQINQPRPDAQNKTDNVVVFSSKSSKQIPPNVAEYLKTKAINNPIGYWNSAIKNGYSDDLELKANEHKEQQERKARIQVENERRKAQEQAEKQALLQEIRKPLNEQFTREQAINHIRTMANLIKRHNHLRNGLITDLATIYNLNIDEIINAKNS